MCFSTFLFLSFFFFFLEGGQGDTNHFGNLMKVIHIHVNFAYINNLMELVNPLKPMNPFGAKNKAKQNKTADLHLVLQITTTGKA